MAAHATTRLRGTVPKRRRSLAKETFPRSFRKQPCHFDVAPSAFAMAIP